MGNGVATVDNAGVAFHKIWLSAKEPTMARAKAGRIFRTIFLSALSSSDLMSATSGDWHRAHLVNFNNKNNAISYGEVDQREQMRIG